MQGYSWYLPGGKWRWRRWHWGTKFKGAQQSMFTTACYRCSSILAALFCVVLFDMLLRKLHSHFEAARTQILPWGLRSLLAYRVCLRRLSVSCEGAVTEVCSPWPLPRQWFRWLISEFQKWLFLYIFCLEIKLSRMTALDLLSVQHEGGKLTQTWVEESRTEV